MDTHSALLTLVVFGAAAAIWFFVTRNAGRSSGEEGEDFVPVFRCDMGQGYSDADIISLIGFLGSRGVRATYDVAYAGEGIVIKTYAVKVAADQLDEGREALAEWLRQEGSDYSRQEGDEEDGGDPG